MPKRKDRVAPAPPPVAAQIVVGEYYTARVNIEHPERKTVTAHVRVIQEVEPDLWMVESSFSNDQYDVPGSALTPETPAMRESRLETERLWGTKWVKKGESPG